MVLASVVISTTIRIFSPVHTEPWVNEGMEPLLQLRRTFVWSQTGIVPPFSSTPPVLSLSSIRGTGSPFNDTGFVCGFYLFRFGKVGH
jgi:hypothetical protein